MAELVGSAFLSASLQVIFERLASSGIKDYFRGRKLNDGLLKKLGITLNSINQVLEDAEVMQYKSPYVKKWLDDLKHTVYEAEQLLDEIATEALRRKLKAEFKPATPTSKVRGFFKAFTKPYDREIESRLKGALENLEFLAKQKDVLGLRQGIAGNEVGVSWKLSSRLPTTSLVDESNVYGRDGDREEIVKFLLSGDGDIITIVGMGGMGKTTLAQLVYNDQRMQDQFDVKAWVYVSQDFDVVRITKAILKAFQFSTDEAIDLNILQLELKQRLMEKKLLLVLDDVWNENHASWELVQVPLNYGSSGSKILVTTRNEKVALVMNSSQLLHLNPLEKEYCWKLFVKYAFHDKDAGQYSNLESLGRKIVKKCQGLPLAIKTLGNLLRKRFSSLDWDSILESDLWLLSENDSDINPALRLSYHDLSSNLKRCFAYCSIFPKGYMFDKDELIKLWMAEGFLNCCQRYKSEEELGGEFFNDLVSRSFFQCIDSLFVMHDLLNDLAKSVSGEFCLQIEGRKVQDISERTRHIRCNLASEHFVKSKGLRSLMGSMGMMYDFEEIVPHVPFSRLKYLRVLSFKNHHLLTKLADDISNLKLLRYLDLSNTGIRSLPDSICLLHNLQTLLLKHCFRLTELPSDFYKLVNLCHLDLCGTSIKKMPKHIGKLDQLRTLTDFVVGEQSGSDIKELGNLYHLQGTLSIERLENVIDPTDAMEANMEDKKHLEGLLLYWGDKFHMTTEHKDSIIVGRVLEALQPNSNLKRLLIVRYGGTNFPNWFGGCHLSNLASLNLSESKSCVCLPPLGQLPSLKDLFISGFYGIKVIDLNFYGNNSTNVPFRSLETLTFEDMYAWEEWCSNSSFGGHMGDEGFPCLKELSIRRCPRLKRTLPKHLPSLQKLEISGCQEFDSLLPKATDIGELVLRGCENVLLKNLPSSLKRAIISGILVVELSLEQILVNNSSLEELQVREFHDQNQEWPSFNLHWYNSLRSLSITNRYSSLPFRLDLLFTNLHSLKLYSCPKLESFPEGGLPSSLGKLVIKNCPKLIASREEWGLSELHSLKEFAVSDLFENVESFPEERLLPPNITHLTLYDCSKLRTINYKGLLHLKSLKFFTIQHCPLLECLPEQGVPNSLSSLSIYGCPLLRLCYLKEGGEHWHKICHIPSVTID